MEIDISIILDQLIKLHKKVFLIIIIYNFYRVTATPIFQLNVIKIKNICELEVLKSKYELHNHKIKHYYF